MTLQKNLHFYKSQSPTEKPCSRNIFFGDQITFSFVSQMCFLACKDWISYSILVICLLSQQIHMRCLLQGLLMHDCVGHYLLRSQNGGQLLGSGHWCDLQASGSISRQNNRLLSGQILHEKMGIQKTLNGFRLYL